MKYILSICLLCLLLTDLHAQSVQTKCFFGPTQSYNNTTGTLLPSVNFVPGVDIPVGHKVVDVLVEIVWSKTDDGSCTAVTGIPTDLSHVGFLIQGPTGGSRFLAASASTGLLASTTSSFAGSMNVIQDTIVFKDGYSALLPAGLPVLGRDTVAPNNDPLNYYKGANPYGNWSISAIDDTPSSGPSLCIHSYCITLVTCDHTALIANCKYNPTINLNSTGLYQFQFADLDSSSLVPCLIKNVSFSPSSVDCSDAGSTVPVIMTIEDQLDSTSVCVSNVLVQDFTAPIAICNNHTLYLNNFGTASLTPTAINNASADNCGIASMTVNGVNTLPFTCANIGANPVTLTVHDINGNSGQCISTVFVVDTIAPVAGCIGNANVWLDAQGSFTANPALLNNSSTDNCGIATLLINGQSSYTFTCADIGTSSAVLTVIDLSGNRDSCTSMVTVIDTFINSVCCVWPGDTDDDGIVNNNDILPIGLHYNTSGTVRNNASSTFVCQPSNDWGTSLLSNSAVDIKHVDADGNGLIEALDTNAIMLNWSQTHQKNSSTSSTGVLIYVDTAVTQPGDTVTLDILLASSFAPSNGYGIAFTVHYDPSGIDTNSVSIHFDNSWLGNINSNLIGIYKNFYTQGKVEIGMTRIDQTLANGGGAVAQIQFIIKDDVLPKSSYIRLDFDVSAVHFIDNLGSPILTTTVPSQILVVNSTVGLNPINKVENEVRIFPNPTNSMVNVQSQYELVESISLFDLTGRLLLKQLNINDLQAQMDLSPFPNGLYILNVQSAGQSKNIQIIKQ